VGERRSKRQPIQGLRHTCLLDIVVLVFAPVARGESRLDAASHNLVLQGIGQSQRLEVGGSQLLVDVLAHVIRVLLELLSEYLSEKHASHVEALLAVVVSVVLSRPAECADEHSVGHVAHEVGLLEHAVRLRRDVWQEVALQQQRGEADTQSLLVLGLLRSLRNVV